jgi:hypothetical protein
MTRFLILLLATLAIASAFAPLTPLRSSPKPQTQLHMFSAEEGTETKGLSEVAPGESLDAASALETSTGPEFGARPKMTVLNRNTGELMEVEINESFLANDKFEMNWWAWVGFVAFPVVLLTNDVFHYLPTDGPLGFLGTL